MAFHIITTVEHASRRSKSGILHRGTDLHRRYLVVIAFETYRIGGVDRIIHFGDTAAVGAQVVIIIRQKTAYGIEDSIYFVLLYEEIPRIARSTVRTGVRLVYMVHSVANRAFSADKRRTAVEHIRRIGQYRAGAPVVGTENRLKARTIVEHGAHIRYLADIERTQVNRLKVRTGIEHSLHILYRSGIERAEVYIGKRTS